MSRTVNDGIRDVSSSVPASTGNDDYDYLIYKSGTTFYGLDGSSGQLKSSSTNCATVIHALIDLMSTTAGGSILLKFTGSVTQTVTIDCDYVTLASWKKPGGNDDYGAPTFSKIILTKNNASLKGILLRGLNIKHLSFEPGGDGANLDTRAVHRVNVIDCNFRPSTATLRGVHFNGYGDDPTGQGYTWWVVFERCNFYDYHDESGDDMGAITISSDNPGNGQIYFNNCAYQPQNDNTVMLRVKAGAKMQPNFTFNQLFYTNAAGQTGTQWVVVEGSAYITNLEVFNSTFEEHANATAFAITDAADTGFHCKFYGNTFSDGGHTGGITVNLLNNAVTTGHWAAVDNGMWIKDLWYKQNGATTLMLGTTGVLPGEFELRFRGGNYPGRETLVPRVIPTTTGASVARTLGAAGRVYLFPVQVERACMVDGVGVTWENTAVDNVRVGVYRDNGDTPVGGALVTESASTAITGTYRTQEIAVTAAYLTPGVYWVALQSDDTTTICYGTSAGFATAGTFTMGYYNRGGGYGAMTDPCPAVTATTLGIFGMYMATSAVFE